MKKTLSLATILTFFASLFTFGISGSTAGTYSDISAWGRQAVAQIATCINSSGQKDVLNVLFLIDESGSLKWNDKKNLRVEGLKTSLEMFVSISKYRPYFTVNRAFSTFADDFKVISGKEWAPLTEKSVSEDKRWIESTIPRLVTGQTTDYARALDGAHRYMEPKVSSNSCNLLLWFTDGALNVAPSSGSTPTAAASESAYQQICGVNPRTGVSTGGGAIIDRFRSSGINIQGILLRNEDVISNPGKYNLKKEAVEDESRGMTYFKPIIEYSGNVDTAYFNGRSEREIRCGSPTGAKGVVTVVGDPIDIIWPPTVFECVTSSGRVIEAQGSDLTIDPGFSRFRASALKDGFILKNSSGQTLATSTGPALGDVSVSFFGQDDAAISVSGNIVEGSVLSTGKWKYITNDYNRSVFCGYLDLAIEIKNDPCYVSENCSFSGVITRNSKEVNFSEFKSSDLRYGLSSVNNAPISYRALAIDENGKFQGIFNPAGETDSQGLVNVIVTLDVTTQSGYEFAFSAIQQVQQLPPGLYPEVIPNPISVLDFTAPLDGKSGMATAPLTLQGPSRTKGEICFSDLEIRTDPNPNRVNGYQAFVDGKNLKEIGCISIGAGESLDRVLTITNADAADGIVSGFIPVIFKSEGLADISGKVPITFESKIKINDLRFWIIFILCMLLGLLLPLTVLKLLQVRAARITISPLSKATTPVILSASGGFVSIRRAEKAFGSDIFKESDFEGYLHTESKEKQIQIGSETLRGNAPLNPFAAPRAILSTAPGMIVASSNIWATNKHGLNRNESTASLNPASAMHLTLSETALASLKEMNRTGDLPDFPIEGNITGLLNLNAADPITQVSALNMKLSTESGWLNNLLKITDLPVDTPDSIGGGRESDWNQPQPINDGWGSASSPIIGASRSNSKITDDGWGNSTNSGANDWGTSGDSGSSSSKNDDW